jgi:uncharacterized protein (DUF58 family)
MTVTESSGIVGQQRSWHATDGLAWAVVIGWLAMLFGIMTGEVAPAGFATSIMIATGWAWYQRPHEAGSVWLTRNQEPDRADGLWGRIRWQPAAGADGLHVRVSAPGHRPVEALLAAPRGASQRDVGCRIRTARTGRRPIFTLDHAETSAERLFALSGAREPPLSLTVLPPAARLREVPLPTRLHGMTGPHESRRAGDGGDLRNIALFTPGDRLRRIDWRTTARHRSGSGPLTDLYVRRTNATADAAVMLVLDSRDDVGPDLQGWNDSSNQAEDQPTSLDYARAAAASLARRYLNNGDRVGLEDLGRYRRPVPPAGGSRHLQRLITRIALSEPEGEPRLRRRPPRIPSGALVVLCSTFLDQQASQLALWWQQAGHRVIAIDVLPAPELTRAPHRLVTGYRIVAMERADRLAQLAAAGIEVVRWPTSADAKAVNSVPAPQPAGIDPAGIDPATALAVSARRRIRR